MFDNANMSVTLQMIKQKNFTFNLFGILEGVSVDIYRNQVNEQLLPVNGQVDISKHLNFTLIYITACANNLSHVAVFLLWICKPRMVINSLEKLSLLNR